VEGTETFAPNAFAAFAFPNAFAALALAPCALANPIPFVPGVPNAFVAIDSDCDGGCPNTDVDPNAFPNAIARAM